MVISCVYHQEPCFGALLQYSYDNRAFLGCDAPVSLQASPRSECASLTCVVVLDQESMVSSLNAVLVFHRILSEEA